MSKVKCANERNKDNVKDRKGQSPILAALEKHGYRLGNVIGEGSYSKVRTAVKFYDKNVYQRMACKVINKRRASQDFVEKFLPRELSILGKLRHPNIIRVFDIFETPDHVYVFSNLCERGDLLEYVKLHGHLEEFKARSFFRKLVSAIHYLHSQDISHRDLKCENVLITATENLVLGDFGFARSCRDPQTLKRILSHTFCGSAAYAAPEILQGVPYNPQMYDIWSLGVVLYIMVTGAMPFDDVCPRDLLAQQLSRSFEKRQLSSPVLSLLMRMLEPDVTRRATIAQLTQTPWCQISCFPPSSRLHPCKFR